MEQLINYLHAFENRVKLLSDEVASLKKVNEKPVLPKFINIADIANITHKTPATVRVMKCNGQLPEPVNPGGGRPLWNLDDILEWQKNRKRKNAKERSIEYVTQHPVKS